MHPHPHFNYSSPTESQRTLDYLAFPCHISSAKNFTGFPGKIKHVTSFLSFPSWSASTFLRLRVILLLPEFPAMESSLLWQLAWRKLPEDWGDCRPPGLWETSSLQPLPGIWRSGNSIVNTDKAAVFILIGNICNCFLPTSFSFLFYPAPLTLGILAERKLSRWTFL